jgi:hypothetical protein
LRPKRVFENGKIIFSIKKNCDILGSICIKDLKPTALDVVFYALQLCNLTELVAESPKSQNFTQNPKFDCKM